MTTRERVHHLVDSLPEDDLEAIEQYLNRLHETNADPVQRAFLRAATLPPDDLSKQDIAALDEAIRDEDAISHDEVRRMLLNNT